MPVNWKAEDAYTRLLAAMVAANDMKLDYRKIATMYGNGATYDSIESRFRIIRKEADVLKTEIESGKRPEAPARGEKGAAAAGKKKGGAAGVVAGKKGGKREGGKRDRDRVVGGRVGKGGKGKGVVKEEDEEEEEEVGEEGEEGEGEEEEGV